MAVKAIAISWIALPAAPTAPVVDNTANTFGFTPAAGYAATDHEYRVAPGGGAFGAWADVTVNPIAIGDIAVDAGDVEVRVKAVGGVNAASAALASDAAFTVGGGGGGGYQQNFNALTTGNLHGQDSWSTAIAAEFQVQTGVVFEGAKGVSVVTGSDGLIARDFTAETSGSKYIALRKSSAANGKLWVWFNNTAAEIIKLRLNNSTVEYWNGTAGAWNSFGALSADQWYVFNVEWDASAQPDKYRVRYHNGTSWSAFTAWLFADVSFPSINRIRVQSEHTGVAATCYFDTITETNPIP
jgi:hypothetical protein